MIPIEAVVLLVILIFGAVGVSRTLPRELGATVAFVGLILALQLLGVRMGPLAAQGLTAAGMDVSQDLAAWIGFSAVIVVVVVLVYHGESLTYNAIMAAGPVGKLFDFSVGMLNGWLVVGTWWYYTHVLNYPIREIGLYVDPLSSRAELLVQLTPVALVPEGRALYILSAILVALVGLKVVR